MMGHNFWAGLANRIGVKIESMGAPLVKTANAALSEIEVVPLPDRIPMREALAAGFHRYAKPMGWGLYQTEDIDGGLGSIWSIEKSADGTEFLVKQVSPEGEVLRKTANAKTARIVEEDGSYKVESEEGKNLGSGYKSKGEAEKRLRQVEYFKHHKGSDAGTQRVAVAPPGEEKLVKKLKHDPEVDNPWAVAWSVHNKKKATIKDKVLGPLATVSATGVSASDIKTAGEGEVIYDQVLTWMKHELTKALGPGERRLSDEELGMKAMEQFGIDPSEASGILVIAHSETGA